jgi:signal transduction histidine kinase
VRRERRIDALRAVAEQERSVLAREVHDVVGHSLAVIIVQAGAADDVFDRNPERARESVRAIDAAARAALAEVRGVIAGAGQRHGMADLAVLADAIRRTGLAVDLQVEGDASAVPAGVAASTYRIVQEALTNTLRHARARTATVVVGCDADQVRISVCDDGAPPGKRGQRSGGHGLAGMRARAELHGGSFESGRLPGGGFRVQARLPVGGAR